MKNKNYATKIFLLVVILGIVVISGCANNNNKIDNTAVLNKNNQNTNTLSFKTISSGSTQDGDALVDLTPHSVENGILNVDFAVNTHSVDLSQYDLLQITMLEYDGNTLKPTSAPSLSGHHNSGTLVFDTGKELKSFKIIIKDIPDIEERIFEWNIK